GMLRPRRDASKEPLPLLEHKIDACRGFAKNHFVANLRNGAALLRIEDVERFGVDAERERAIGRGRGRFAEVVHRSGTTSREKRCTRNGSALKIDHTSFHLDLLQHGSRYRRRFLLQIK